MGRQCLLAGVGVLAALVAIGCGADDPIAVPAPRRAPEAALAAAPPPQVVERPMRLEIPAINVDAPIEPLELDADGALGVPKDPEMTGWFTGGPEPGENGNAIIVGHLDSKTGPAVFHRLRDLNTGDRIVVHGDGGTRVEFEVATKGQYSKSDFPTDDVYGASTSPALRLITCGGGFDRRTKHYKDNLVIYAWLADST